MMCRPRQHGFDPGPVPAHPRPHTRTRALGPTPAPALAPAPSQAASAGVKEKAKKSTSAKRAREPISALASNAIPATPIGEYGGANAFTHATTSHFSGEGEGEVEGEGEGEGPSGIRRVGPGCCTGRRSLQKPRW